METIARCYCGTVEVGFDSPPRGTVHCHCGECRRQTGAAFTTWVSVPSPPVLREGAKAAGKFSATRNTVRHFCRICGSHLYTVDVRHPDIVGVPAGAIVEPMQLVPTAHYFVDDKAPWHEISDGLPQFGGRSGVEPVGAPSVG